MATKQEITTRIEQLKLTWNQLNRQRADAFGDLTWQAVFKIENELLAIEREMHELRHRLRYS